MKIGRFFKGAALVVAMACPMFTSCYNDAAIWNEIEGIHGDVADLKSKLAALESKLNSDLQALQTLLEGQIRNAQNDLEDQIGNLENKVNGLVTVKNVVENKDGSVTITLSDNTVFTVHPKFEQDYEGLVTTVTIGGVVYWAIYDETGKAVAVEDAEGELVPVIDVVPQVRVDKETALVEISFDGGNEWIEIGYNEPCVFEGAEVVSNEADGMPMYVVLTLPDGNTITVTVDGSAVFMFGNPYLGGASTVQYVSVGTTTVLDIYAWNIEGWVKEVPAGWIIEENTDNVAEYGMGSFSITAPTAEAVAAGVAVAEGDMKLIAVAKGGKPITATIRLTSCPFKTIAAAKGNVTVEMNKGLGGYLLGVSTVADFDKEAILAELKAVVEEYDEMWEEYTWSPWYTGYNDTPLDDNYMDSSIQDYPLSFLELTEELVPGELYVVWAVGLNMDMQKYCYTVADMATVTYLNASITMEEPVVSFNDIQIEAEFVGVTSFYGGFEAQSEYAGYETTIEDVVYNINEAFSYGYAPTAYMVGDAEGWNEGVYTGNPNDLVNGYQSIQPSRNYYLYIVPVIPGKTEYTVADVYWYEFTTEDLIAGGTLVPTAGEATVDYNKISVPLNAEGAVYMYYAYVEPEMVSTIADKQAYLLENGNMSKGAKVTANKSNIAPGATFTLLAMAVDQNGCYGDVFQKDYTSKAMTYASATVTAELQGTPSKTGKVKISCDADVDTYYYWYQSTDHFTWGTSYYGTTAESASAFIALTPNSYYMNKVTAAALPADGIEMTGLTVGTPYYFVVSAKLTNGEYTKATMVSFTPAMNLGNFVYATDDNGNENAAWVAAKPTVTYEVATIGDFTTVEWKVSVPAGFTAKTACFHKDYLTDYPSAKDKVQYIITDEYVNGSYGAYDVVEGETYVNGYASPGYNIYTVVCDAEGNYYETYVTELNITGGFGV